MANPNIINATTILGVTSLTSLTSTSVTSLVSNAASSNKVFKINSIIVANVDGTAAADITVNIYNNATAGSGSAFAVASTVSVPADATLVVVDKTSAFYLLENHSIGAIASAANDLQVVVSYEEIS